MYSLPKVLHYLKPLQKNPILYPPLSTGGYTWIHRDQEALAHVQKLCFGLSCHELSAIKYLYPSCITCKSHVSASADMNFRPLTYLSPQKKDIWIRLLLFAAKHKQRHKQEQWSVKVMKMRILVLIP